MRLHERIPVFLKLVDWTVLVKELGLSNGTDTNTQGLVNNIKDNLGTIVYEWTRNPDLRIGQLLINLGVLPDHLELWNLEYDEILKKQGIESRLFLFWGTYGKEKDAKILFKAWKKSRACFGLSKKESKSDIDSLLIMLSVTTTKENKKAYSLYTRLATWLDTKPKLKYKLICDLNTKHIKNILKTQDLSKIMLEALISELAHREVK